LYIWAKFDSDIIQMLGSEISELVEEDDLEKNEIRRLRVELTSDGKADDYADEFFSTTTVIRYAIFLS
jgi:hypothetical protein